MVENIRLPRKEVLQPDELRGIFVPTVTPFKMTGIKKELDVISHMRNISNLARPGSGVSGIFLGSNAGNGRDMPIDDLKLSITSGLFASRSANPNLPVVVGALRSDISEVIEVVRFAEQKGADAIVLAPGFTQGHPIKILETICKQSKLPIIIYNNPGFQNEQDLSLEFIRAAAENPRVIGIKDTSGKPEYFEEVLNIFHAKGKKVLQGDTKAGLNESIRRADGMVPVEANLYPEVLAGLIDPSIPYNSDDLVSTLNYIKLQKGDFGGTLGFIRHLLFENHIFETELSYTSKK